ncbi:hypothetical protein M408DRAFT_30049 [Serendipita vermifera MAFF 305830]|uniref:F-box domain-containing protein n=1 Tax=Serendipita vermifera MAFF 305830 TaxID=933852 RepID=A0A0C3A889_SERVB|nr:hypothetical protein M408DRAFT_30049 [Serendipita vermifera MAFF 305830]
MATHSTSSDPPEIRKKLEALQFQHELIEELRSRISAAELECVRLETEIFEYRASVAPVRRCPQELLLMFFEYYTCENPRLIRRLLLVCKQWYELAISSPRLWNRIPITFDPEWDVESTCDFIRKRLQKCIDLSGSLPLELNVDFGNFVSPEELIRSKIREDLFNYVQSDECDTFHRWIDDLDVDIPSDPEVISICQTHHLFRLLEILIGEDGNTMSRWGTLCLDLPLELELAVGIMELFSHATPSLLRLKIDYFGNMHEGFDSLIGTIFPDLSALEHLEVGSTEDLELFKLNPTSMQILTFKDMISCNASIFTPFTRLQQLDVLRWRPRSLAEDSYGVVHLPELRRLSVRGPVMGFGTFEFRVPVLDKLHLSRGNEKAPCIYPKVQASRISWGLEIAWLSDWTPDEIKSDIRAILLQYRSATELQLPSRLREMVLALVEELKSDDTWRSALRFINLAAKDGTVLETIEQMATRSTPADPPEICRKLEALQHQHEIIEDLRSRISSAELECARLETEISEYRDSVAPIRKCPQELLLMFFEYYTRENSRLIRDLLPVCKQWYELAISSPRLWNRIPIKLETDFDIESTCKTIKKRLNKCIDLSGTVPLELHLDFHELLPPQDLIRSQIRENLLNHTHPDEQDTLNMWIRGLDVDLLSELEVISACRPRHLFKLLRILIGKGGNIMPWWDSLRLELPEDTELALRILKLFSHPTPSLTRLQINCFEDMCQEYATLVGSTFPDLSALKHLEVPNASDLGFFKFDPTLLQSLTISDMKSCDTSIFTPFIRLQQLDVRCWSALGQAGDSHGVIHLPELRRLLVTRPFKDFGTFEFRVPVLDELHISRRHAHDPFIYPKVQASRIIWGLESPWASQWKLDEVEPDFRAILLLYRGARELQIPSHLKKKVSTIIRELKLDETWLSALRVINLEAEDGRVLETIEVQKL